MARTLPTRAGGCCQPREGIHPLRGSLQGQSPVHNPGLYHDRLKPVAGGLTVRLRGRDATDCEPYGLTCLACGHYLTINP